VEIYDAEKNAEKYKRISPVKKQEIIKDMRKDLEGLPRYSKEHSLLKQIMPHFVLIKPETAENQSKRRKAFSFSRKAES
jgi:hypothetical protein